MSLATGGRAIGATSTRSSSDSRARRRASSMRTIPTCSPAGPTSRTSGTRMRSLIRGSVLICPPVGCGWVTIPTVRICRRTESEKGLRAREDPEHHEDPALRAGPADQPGRDHVDAVRVGDQVSACRLSAARRIGRSPRYHRQPGRHLAGSISGRQQREIAGAGTIPPAGIDPAELAVRRPRPGGGPAASASSTSPSMASGYGPATSISTASTPSDRAVWAARSRVTGTGRASDAPGLQGVQAGEGQHGPPPVGTSAA